MVVTVGGSVTKIPYKQWRFLNR